MFWAENQLQDKRHWDISHFSVLVILYTFVINTPHRKPSCNTVTVKGHFFNCKPLKLSQPSFWLIQAGAYLLQFFFLGFLHLPARVDFCLHFPDQMWLHKPIAKSWYMCGPRKCASMKLHEFYIRIVDPIWKYWLSTRSGRCFVILSNCLSLWNDPQAK